MKNDLFDEGFVMSQLEAAGIWVFYNLMRKGYPSHLGINDVHEKYSTNLSAAGLNLETKLFCDLLLRSVGIKKTDFKIGSTKIMLRPGNSVLIDRLNDFRENIIKQNIVMIKRKLLALSKWKVISYAVLFHIHCEPSFSILSMKNNLLKTIFRFRLPVATS